MNKKRSIKKVVSLFLAMLMVISVIPFSAVLAAGRYLCEFYSASGTDYFSIAVLQYSTKSNGAAEDQLRGLGFNPVGINFNAGDGHDSDYVHLGIKTSKNPTEAIRAFRIYVGGERPNSITSTINGSSVTFYKIGSGATSWTQAFGSDGVVDLNKGHSGSPDLTLYATRDPNAGPPITEFCMTQGGNESSGQQYLSGWYHATSFDNVNVPKDVNAGQGSKADYVYCHWRSSATAVNTDDLRSLYSSSYAYTTDDRFTSDSRSAVNSARSSALTVMNAFDNNAGVANYTQSDINTRKNNIDSALKDLKTTVYFDGNGGTVTKSSKTFTIGKNETSQVGVSDVTASRVGYDFKGWATSNMSTTGSTSTMTLGHNKKVYAVWSAHKSTLSVSPNGGTWNGSSSTQRLENTYGKTLPIPVPSRQGYQFAGWSKNIINGSITGTDANPQTYTYGPTAGKTDSIVASWTKNNYQVKFNGNGGSGEMSNITCSVDTPFNLPANSFTRTGYHFVGWALSSSNSAPVVYTDEQQGLSNLTYEKDKTVELFAKWEINHYTVAYHPNGGSGSMPNTSCTYNQRFQLPNNSFSRTGYTFAGWATTANGRAEYQPGNYAKNLTEKDNITVTFYAVWTPVKYKITFVNEDGTALWTNFFDYESYPVYGGSTPTKEASNESEFIFDGWMPAITQVKGEATYTAKFKSEPRKYKVYFLVDGKTFHTQDVAYGSTPVYDGKTPTKDPSGGHGWKFIGWDRDFTPVTGAGQRYNAMFEADYGNCTATFLDGNGDVLIKYELPYGSTIVYDGPTPVKEQDAQFTYTFSGWDPVPGKIIADTTFTPFFSRAFRHYEIKFVSEGTELTTLKVNYGTTPKYKGTAPTKAPTIDKEYTFAGWEPAIVPCEGPATYTAKFTESTRKYQVTFKNENGEVVYRDAFEYNTTPVCPIVPTKAGTNAVSYVFNGWDNALAPVTGDAVYTATYRAETAKHTITFLGENNEILEEKKVEYGTMPVFGGATPVKEQDVQYTYTFAGWDNEIVTVTGPATYTATFTKELRRYTVKFLNEDGTVLQSTDVEYGATPVYSGATPVKESTEINSYRFEGWDNELVPVIGEATYTATYTETVRFYVVTFKNEDGTTLDSVMLPHGATPEYYGTTPEKASDVQYSYIFAGWDKELVAVTADATYTATFTSEINKYNVVFMNYNGEILQSTQVEYGTTPVYNSATPLKRSDVQYNYTFTGWDREIVAVTGVATYTAQYTSSIREYTITFENDNGEILEEKLVAFDELPEYTGATPVKASTAQYSYTWTGEWNKPVKLVEGDTTYIATFTSKVNEYHIIFKDGDTVLQDSVHPYGTTPRYNGTNPTRATDDEYIYTFAGWNETFKPIVGETVFTAKYNTRANSFTVKFVDENGKTLQSKNYKLGEMPVYEGVPSRDYDAQYHYTFVGWDKEITEVTGFTTYTAKFERAEHTLQTFNETAPTCTADGVKTLACVCGFAYTQNTPPTGHKYGEAIKEGKKAYRECSVCGDRIEIPMEELENEQSVCETCGEHHYKYIFPDLGRLSCIISRFFTFLAQLFGAK